MFNYALFGKRLRTELIRRCYTIESLSQLTRIPETTLHGYETQSAIVDIEDLVKIADVLGVNLNYLVIT